MSGTQNSVNPFVSQRQHFNSAELRCVARSWSGHLSPSISLMADELHPELAVLNNPCNVFFLQIYSEQWYTSFTSWLTMTLSHAILQQNHRDNPQSLTNLLKQLRYA